jgi:dihydrolipoamide dehydrogenase
LGGACLHRGCIPTKALIASLEILQKVREAEDYGIEIPGEVTWNLKKMMGRKDRVVESLSNGIWGLLKSWGVELVEGRGTLVSANEIRVARTDGTSETVTADKIILATGSEPARNGPFPVDGVKIITSDEALVMTEIPKSILIVGAGVVGCEFASIFQELGSKVIVTELLPEVLSAVDQEVAGILVREFRKKKIELHTKARIREIGLGDDGEVKTRLEDGTEYSTEKVLISIGREFNTAGIGLETIGVELGPKGNIQVNSRMETNVPGVYAVGDVTGIIMLAHVASAQGIVAVENALGHSRDMDYRVIPAGIFTMPEIGCVGITERQAREAQKNIQIGRFLFRGLGKAHATGEVTGMVKIISDAEDDKVLGVHIIGSHAADLIHEAAFAIKMGATIDDLAHTVHAHPTLAEAVKEAAEDGLGMAVHLPKKKQVP